MLTEIRDGSSYKGFTLDPLTSNYVTDPAELTILTNCLETFTCDVFEDQFDVESFSYNFQCALVLNEPYTPIKCIKNQTEELQILSVSQAPVMFFYTRNHSENVVNVFLDQYEVSEKDFPHHFTPSYFERTEYGHARFLDIKMKKMREDIPNLPRVKESSFDPESIFGYDQQFRQELQKFFPDEFVAEYDDMIMTRLGVLWPRLHTYEFIAPFEPMELALLRHLRSTYPYMKNPTHSDRIREALVYGSMNGTL